MWWQFWDPKAHIFGIFWGNFCTGGKIIYFFNWKLPWRFLGWYFLDIGQLLLKPTCHPLDQFRLGASVLNVFQSFKLWLRLIFNGKILFQTFNHRSLQCKLTLRARWLRPLSCYSGAPNKSSLMKAKIIWKFGHFSFESVWHGTLLSRISIKVFHQSENWSKFWRYKNFFLPKNTSAEWGPIVRCISVLSKNNYKIRN